MAMTREDNELLTRVDNGAPMGEMIRQHYWIPAVPRQQAGGRRRAAARAPARRQLRRLPRHRRPRRRDRRAMPASPRIARARAQRRQRPALPVPRLEDQRAWRSGRGAQPCRRPAEVLRARARESLRRAGARRHRLGLARQGRHGAEVPRPALRRPARRAPRGDEPGSADQLGAGGRSVDGLVARRRAARVDHARSPPAAATSGC